MDISIIGATGGCGREIATQLIRDGVLERREILQLVSSNPKTRHPHLLQGLRADLQDAYAEIIPEIDVTDDPEQIIGDVIVMAAGVTFSTDINDLAGGVNRDVLARTNAEVFERFARAIGNSQRSNPPVVIIVSNPVELGVHIFSKYLPREHVIGMGSYSDSMRFRWEIASELGVPRQRVQAYMLGEHGNGMVPIWSSVRVQGMSQQEWQLAEMKIRDKGPLENFPSRLNKEQLSLMQMLTSEPDHGPGKALNYVSTLPPDLRVALKPFAIHYAKAKTQTATATATTELVKAVFEGRSMEIAVQYQHRGEFGIYCPFGARVILAGTVQRVLGSEEFSSPEQALLRKSANNIQEKIKEWTNHG